MKKKKIVKYTYVDSSQYRHNNMIEFGEECQRLIQDWREPFWWISICTSGNFGISKWQAFVKYED